MPFVLFILFLFLFLFYFYWTPCAQSGPSGHASPSGRWDDDTPRYPRYYLLRRRRRFELGLLGGPKHGYGFSAHWCLWCCTTRPTRVGGVPPLSGRYISLYINYIFKNSHGHTSFWIPVSSTCILSMNRRAHPLGAPGKELVLHTGCDPSDSA
jgi:hypothetical protein